MAARPRPLLKHRTYMLFPLPLSRWIVLRWVESALVRRPVMPVGVVVTVRTRESVPDVPRAPPMKQKPLLVFRARLHRHRLFLAAFAVPRASLPLAETNVARLPTRLNEFVSQICKLLSVPLSTLRAPLEEVLITRALPREVNALAPIAVPATPIASLPIVRVLIAEDFAIP